MNATFELGRNVRVRTNVRLSDHPNNFDEVAIWSTESVGGVGLQALGIIESSEIASFSSDRSIDLHEEFVLFVKITALVVHAIRKSDLALVRGTNDGSPMSVLDAGGYFQSHRKIKRVDEAVARFIRSRFV
ncbi:MAG: hypothetical protein V4586_02440 [Pseudomonadota bacterium]